MKLLYGTNNPAKLDSMRKMLSQLSFEIVGLRDLGYDVPDVDENGDTPLENARTKAFHYNKATGLPVFSCDSGLYFENADPSLQPGVRVRNVNGKRLSDDEMIEYYSTLAKNHGGKLIARYINAIAFIDGDGALHEHMGDDISSHPFIISDVAHITVVPGFPLDSLSKTIDTNEYYYDIVGTRSESDMVMFEGFCSFFQRALCF